jgi:hypothetical protein
VAAAHMVARARVPMAAERKRRTAGKGGDREARSSTRSLYSAGIGGIDLVRPWRAVDPVASAWLPSCLQARGG